MKPLYSPFFKFSTEEGVAKIKGSEPKVQRWAKIKGIQYLSLAEFERNKVGRIFLPIWGPQRSKFGVNPQILNF